MTQYALRYSNELTIGLICKGMIDDQYQFSGWIETPDEGRWEFSEILAPTGYDRETEELYDEMAAMAIAVAARWSRPLDPQDEAAGIPEWAPGEALADAINDGAGIGSTGFAIRREKDGEIVYGD